MSAPPEIFDRKVLVQRLGRVARAAGDHDFLLRRTATDLAERLAIVQRSFKTAVNLGAYHGIVSEAIAALPNIGPVINATSPEALLARLSGGKLGVDEEKLPFAPQSLDLIVSGLALHLVNDLPGVLVQAQRALKPDGLLLASLLGGATLHELRVSWIVAEEQISGGASPRVAPFADVRQLGGLLQRAGFALPVADSDTVCVTYADPLALMREIKAMGMSNMLAARRRVPVTRRLLTRAAEVYADRFGLPDGRIQATFEIITLTGWVPHESQPQALKPGSAKTSLADALQTRRAAPSGDT